MTVGWSSLCRRKGRWTYLPNSSGTLRNPKHSIPVTGSSATSGFPVHHRHASPLSPAASHFTAWQAKGGSPSFLGQVSAQQGSSLQEPTPRAPSFPWEAKPGTLHLASARGHLHNLLPQHIPPARDLQCPALLQLCNHPTTKENQVTGQ